MRKSIFALLCVAVFASNLRQPQQTFLTPLEDGIEAITKALTSQVEQLGSFFISKLYPDNADQVQAELQVCQDQAVESLPTMIEGAVGDVEGFVQACTGGNVTATAEKIFLDAIVVLKEVSAGCPNMTVNIGADAEQLFATFVVQTLKNFKCPIKTHNELKNISAQVQEEFEQQAKVFLSNFPQPIQQLFEQVDSKVKAASDQFQAQFEEELKEIGGPILKAITPSTEQAIEILTPIEENLQAQMQEQATEVEQEVAQIGGKLAAAAGVDEATVQKTEADAKVAMSAIQQAFTDAQADTLTPDQLIEALNESLLVVNDFGVAFTDVASSGVEKAAEIASAVCNFISPVVSQVQEKAEEVKGNRQ